jgi:hypothetical protein
MIPCLQNNVSSWTIKQQNNFRNIDVTTTTNNNNNNHNNKQPLTLNEIQHQSLNFKLLGKNERKLSLKHSQQKQ